MQARSDGTDGSIRWVAGVLEIRIAPELGLGQAIEVVRRVPAQALPRCVAGLLVIPETGGRPFGEQDTQRMFEAALDAGLQRWPIAVLEEDIARLPWREWTHLMAIERGFSCALFSDRNQAMVWLRHGLHRGERLSGAQ